MGGKGREYWGQREQGWVGRKGGKERKEKRGREGGRGKEGKGKLDKLGPSQCLGQVYAYDPNIK
jgi:hypothetical protein